MTKKRLKLVHDKWIMLTIVIDKLKVANKENHPTFKIASSKSKLNATLWKNFSETPTPEINVPLTSG